MYWTLYPFDYEGTPERGQYDLSQQQAKEIEKGVYFKTLNFTIEPIGEKHTDLYEKWIKSPLEMDYASFPLSKGFVINDHGQNIAHHILSGLRLLKDDYVKYLYRFSDRTFSFPVFNVVQYPKYILYYNENAQLVDLVTKILALNESEKLMTAINFYNFSYNTSYHPVEQLRKLGNLMTSAEALFVPLGSRNKQGPIRVGISNLLGTDGPSRAHLDYEFEAAYNIRNAFVHSDDVMVQIRRYRKEDISSFVFHIQSYLRQAIVKELK